MVVEALLRIIVGLDATAGTVTTVGQVAAIPQSGTGFQADSSGCGNIYLGGLSLGLSRRLQWRRIRSGGAMRRTEELYAAVLEPEFLV